jgi:hypothetical protein
MKIVFLYLVIHRKTVKYEWKKLASRTRPDLDAEIHFDIYLGPEECRPTTP